MAMAMAEWWAAATEAVAAYTGLTPAAFFTAVAVAAALYVAVSGLLARPAQTSSRRQEEAAEERAFEPLPPPVQLGEVTEEELRAYDGSDPKKPLLMAIKGQIYDVTQSRIFYGPGGPYASFAGRDASRALAKMSFEASDLTGDISGLGPLEVEALQEWEYKFKSKYVTVGIIKKTVPFSEGDAARSDVTTERDIVAGIVESNSVPEPEETGMTNQGSVVEKITESPDIDVNTSSQADAVDKPEEIPNAVVKNRRSIEGAIEAKETPQVEDGKDTYQPEDATEKPNEATDVVDLKNTASHEDDKQPKKTRNEDEKDVSSHQHGDDNPKETSNVEVKNA